MLQTAEIISAGLGLYLLVGLIFALYFVTIGIRGPGIEGRSLILRLFLLPGAMLLWPLLILKKKPS
jgi:hypothetical protein